MSERTDIDLAALRAALSARRAELVELSEASAQAQKPVELDQTRVGRLSRMDAMQVQAMAAETGRRRALDLRRIDAALRRMAEDEYGTCTSCGDAIPAQRLALDPAAAQCIDCARG